MGYDCQLYVRRDLPEYDFIVEIAGQDSCYVEITDTPNVTKVITQFTFGIDYSFIMILIVLLWFYLINSGKIQ